MSINMTSDADKCKDDAKHRARVLHRRKATAAGIAMGSLLLSGLGTTMATASVGGGSVGGGTIGGAGKYFTLYTYDNPSYEGFPYQGWGQDSIRFFANQVIENTGGAAKWPAGSINVSNLNRKFDEACGAALQRATARSSDGKAKSRVVQVGMTYNDTPKGFYDVWGTTEAIWRQGYDKYSPDSLKNGLIGGHTAESRKTVENEFRGYIANNTQVVCVAMNAEEPKDPNYELKIETDKGSTFDMAGSTAPVNDIIHASRGDSKIAETVNGKVHLHWDGPEGQEEVVTKAVQIKNSGDTTSPDFIPEDFGWHTWPAGGFWFDVTVEKQGKMKDAVDTPDRDPRESWDVNPSDPRKVLLHAGTDKPLGDDEVLASGMSYDARLTAHTNGYASSMTIIDTIDVDEVFIGGRDGDDTSKIKMLDPSGQEVEAEFSVDRGTEGKTIVRGTVTDIKVQGEYTMIVPTFVKATKVDYSIPDDVSTCYTADMTDCLTGNSENTNKVTPPGDKVWVVDEAGALKSYDPDHSNAVGSDGKTFAPGSPIGAVVNNEIKAGLAENLYAYTITDDWAGAADYIDFSDASKAKVFFNGADVTSEFDIKVDGTKTIATAKDAFLARTGGLGEAAEVKLYIEGQFRTDYRTDGETEELTNAGEVQWNNEGVDTNVPSVFTVTPAPDKVWALDEEGALVLADPQWTNAVGADNKVFFPAEDVSAVVNGFIPANLGSALSNYTIVDDWSDAVDYIDFTDASKVKVYFGGEDVTSEFRIAVSEGKTTAVATEAFLARTAGLDNKTEVKLIISGNFRTDYRTHGDLEKMVNKGSETWNDVTEPTNTPPVFTWTPDPHKQVVGSSEESGDLAHENIEGLSVWPGQKLEYTVQLDVRIPDNAARGVESLGVEDQFDPNLIPDKDSVEFYDSRTNKPIPRKFYDLSFNEDNNSFVANFDQAWVAENIGSQSAGWLVMRFTGTVNPDLIGAGTVKNQAFQIINGVKIETEVPEVSIPPFEPDKEDLNTDLIDIDGKTVLEGDIILYRLTLDGGPARSELAYNVHKLGLVDDFDEEYLELSEEGIQVTNKDTGEDVTDQFNIQVKDGVAYIFAKQVDSVNAYGEDIPGDPQPADLAAYESAPIEPHKTPIINQDLLGSDYYVTLQTKVIKTTDGYTIENQARQNLQNNVRNTKIVSNPLKEINPDKDVVVSEETKDESIDGQEIAMNSIFNYRLNSSTIPANRAYDAKDWMLVDTFDKTHDYFTGIWAIYANTDVYQGDKLIFEKGGLLMDSAGHESVPARNLFEVNFDEESYTITVKAKEDYLNLINTRGDLEQAFSVYTKMERIAPGEEILNHVDETYNGFERISNEVKTNTPEHPEIAVEKFTLDEGWEEGDRDNVDQALELELDESGLTSQPTQIGIWVENTGDVDLTNVALSDMTLEGTTGAVENITCDVPMDEDMIEALNNGSEEKTDGILVIDGDQIGDLKVGEKLECNGTLIGVEPGTLHSDNVTVTGESIFTGKKVEDEDPWHAKLPGDPAIVVEKYTQSEGLEDGDRDNVKDALELTEAQLNEGVNVVFNITNTGNTKLHNVTLTDETLEDTTGTIEDITCTIPNPEYVPEDEATEPVEGEEVESEEATEGEEAEATEDEATDVVETIEVGPDAIGTLEAGQSIDCVGTLAGVEPGTIHSDNATVTGDSPDGPYGSEKVTDEDPWHAKFVANPAINIEKFTTEEGWETGDRDDTKDALVIDQQKADDGINLTFKVTNTGDVTLNDVKIEDQTWEDTTGKVGEISCLVPEVIEGEVTVPEDGTTEDAVEDEAVAEDETEVDEVAESEATESDDTEVTEGEESEEAEVTDEATEAETEEAADVVEVPEGMKLVAADQIGALAPGAEVDCFGIVEDIEPGTFHSDTATVTGNAGEETVTDDDPWHAKFPTDEVPDPNPGKGAVTGFGLGENDPGFIAAGILALLAALGGAVALNRKGRTAEEIVEDQLG